jgi:hypothetical protein
MRKTAAVLLGWALVLGQTIEVVLGAEQERTGTESQVSQTAEPRFAIAELPLLPEHYLRARSPGLTTSFVQYGGQTSTTAIKRPPSKHKFAKRRNSAASNFPGNSAFGKNHRLRLALIGAGLIGGGVLTAVLWSKSLPKGSENPGPVVALAAFTVAGLFCLAEAVLP